MWREYLPSRDAHKLFSSFNSANLDRMSVDKLYRKIPARIRLSPIFLCSDRINGMFDNYRSACIKVISPMFPYRIYGVVWTSDWLILPFMWYMFFCFLWLLYNSNSRYTHKVISNTSIDVMPTSHRFSVNCLPVLIRLWDYFMANMFFLTACRNDNREKNAHYIKLMARKNVGGNTWCWKLERWTVFRLYSKLYLEQHKTNSFLFYFFF